VRAFRFRDCEGDIYGTVYYRGSVIGACGGPGGIVGLAGVIRDSRICFNLTLHDDLDVHLIWS
jgi:hypothetical protein